MRGLHPLAPARRHPQPVEPRVRRSAARRAAPARRSRRARRRWPAARDIGGSIRIPASFKRRRRLQAALRPRAGRRRRSTSTSTATAGRSPARVADAALLENVLAGPHPRDIVSLRPKLELPARLRGRRGPARRASRRPRRLAARPEVRANTLRRGRRRCARPAPIVEEVDLPRRRRRSVRAAVALHFDLASAAGSAPRPRRTAT